MDSKAKEILDYWIGEVGPAGWFAVNPAVDATIRERWQTLWEQARAGEELGVWSTEPSGALALLVLLDQFPRNMFRGDARSFASDARAIAVARGAVARGFDKRIPLPQRMFFYTPMMHSEILSAQDQSVRLNLVNFGSGEGLLHARAHREVIRRFGRFPYRNAALGRASTKAEEAFLAAGGYGGLLAEMTERPAA